MDKDTTLLGVAVCATAFGAIAVFMGTDGIVITGVFALLGTLAGYILGSKT